MQNGGASGVRKHLIQKQLSDGRWVKIGLLGLIDPTWVKGLPINSEKQFFIIQDFIDVSKTIVKGMALFFHKFRDLYFEMILKLKIIFAACTESCVKKLHTIYGKDLRHKRTVIDYVNKNFVRNSTKIK